MSKKSTRKKFREATTEETHPEESEYSESEEVDRHSPPHTSWQTNMTKDLMTILEFMEKKEISKEEKRLTEEQRRREEDQRKEELRERRYQEDADRREKRLLELLDSKEKIHYKHQRRMLEKKKNLKAIPTWKDSDKPADYFRRFEQVMLCNEEPKDQWARLLSINLSGKASTIFNTRIPTAQQDDYDVVKTVLLDGFGDTVDLARKQWWIMRKETEESFQDCMIRFEEKFKRGMEGCTSILDLVSILSMSKFLSILTPECRTYVLGRNPKDGITAAHLAEEFYRINPWRSCSGHIARYERKDTDHSGSSSQRKDWGSNRSEYAPSHGRQQQFERNKPRTDNHTTDNPKVPTCYGCGEKGHKKPDCPKKIRRIRSPQPKGNTIYVAGKIGDVECRKLVVDSGADLTIIHPDLIPKSLHTGDHTVISMADGSTKTCPITKVWIHVGNRSIHKEVVVFNAPGEHALLGTDLKLHKFLVQLSEDQEEESNSSNRIRVTRKQAAEEAEQEKQDDAATAASGSEPLSLDDIYEYNDSLFEDDDHLDQSQATPEEDKFQLPLPPPDEGHEDRTLLIQQQEEDSSLTNVRRLADEQEKGYTREDGLIVHMENDELGTVWKRVVIPQDRRNSILALAHSNPLAGHLGVKKTTARIRRHFTWPGISRDIKDLCASCPQCQRAARNDQGKAPLSPLPVITVPFSRLALDVVGPMPRTKSGYKYVLTCMCYATKYPDAIPMKRADAKTIAEAMIEIFSRTGLPDEILTDKGPSLVGDLGRSMCDLLQIKPIRTSPYHPETDEMLERWHASFKGMIRKSGVERNEWDIYLKYLLFAYRSVPHLVTGFTPFELIYGRDVRGPLELFKQSWLDGG